MIIRRTPVSPIGELFGTPGRVTMCDPIPPEPTAGTMTEVESFDSFYRGTARRLTRYAYGLTGDPGEAQDLAQEAYARAWQRWRRVRAYDDAEAWLRVVVTRLAQDRWRRLRVRRAAAAVAVPQTQVEPPSEQTVLLVRALREIPAEQRQVLLLHHLLDRSLAEIATETGTNINTVKSRLARGRAALAEILTVEPETITGGNRVQ